MTKELNIEQERREFCAAIRIGHPEWKLLDDKTLMNKYGSGFHFWLLAKRSMQGSAEPVPYPVGEVVGPCVCGSWPGGNCLKCKRTPPSADAKDSERPIDENELWDLLDTVGDALTRRAAPHAWESLTRESGFNFIMKRRTAIAAKEAGK